MVANSALIPVREEGWRRGFANLMRKENLAWWRGRRWIVNLFTWLAFSNGVPAILLWGGETSSDNPLWEGLGIFLILTGLSTAIGATIAMQNTILDERKTGTGGWILSKPVSRTAFILSKLLANSFAMLVLMVVVPGIGIFIQLSLKGGTMFPVLPLVSGLGILALHILFYISLTLMLGTLSQARGPVIGIPLLLILGYQLFMLILPQLGYIMPWGLMIPLGEGSEVSSLAGEVMTGQPLSSPLTLVAVGVWVILFVAVALWRFQREEF